MCLQVEEQIGPWLRLFLDPKLTCHFFRFFFGGFNKKPLTWHYVLILNEVLIFRFDFLQNETVFESCRTIYGVSSIQV